MTKYRDSRLGQVVAVSKALSDTNRVRALAALRGRELCVCQIVALLGLASSTVSKHLSVLETARLVERRKDGRWVYYRRPERGSPNVVTEALSWVDAVLARDPALREDVLHLREILRTPVEELCGSGGGG